MKASKFMEAQISFIRTEGGGHAGRRDLSEGRDQPATYFNWKKRYGGLLPDEMRRLKALED